ncbi:hypothetical protein BC831DRAFT_401767 [Entophlyctis helioformis]|nr:hypothetical protein BC831DRAFT_401767 [Entophlyctis helioformis]
MILVSSLIAEADLFTRHADYPAAIQLYTRALELKPGHVHLLICRSRCRALQGDTTGALKDADEILAQDAKSARGIMCKADALFAAGDFEMAMVWYHRGDRLRGEHVEFKRGVVRCREAIERAMMEVDVEKMRAARAAAKARAAAAAAAGPIAANTGGTGRTGGAAAAATFTTSATAAHPGGAAASGGTPRRALSQQRASELIDHNLLEELFEDYGFLKDLQGDDVFMAAGDGQIGEYVTDAIKYLDGRIEFWRARNPRGLHESTVVDAIQPRRRSLVGPQGKYVAPH